MYLLPFLDIDVHSMENYGNFVFQWYKKQDYQYFMNVLYRRSALVIILFFSFTNGDTFWWTEFHWFFFL